jgi:methylglutamate dehydrogenase subunit A
MSLQRYSAASLLRAAFNGGAHWQPLWQRRDPASAYDVVVVGAGGHGLAVLDKRLVGYGNVGRNTTIVRSNYLLPENHYFYEDSLRRWEELSRVLNYNVMYSPRGVVDLANSDDEMAVLARRAGCTSRCN